MTNQPPNRLEIFLALALERGAPRNFPVNDFLPSLDDENETANEGVSDDLPDEKLSPLYEYLPPAETEKLQSILAEYQNKTATEKADWRAWVRGGIGIDESLIDETIHPSHVFEALQKESPAVQKIIAASLPENYKNQPEESFEKTGAPLEKTVRRAFAEQFVALRDLREPTAFDRLDGAQLARLIRLAGIREVALACVRIEAVESVAAFLRRFSAEDARAAAAQINNLRGAPEARLDFAENLVQTFIEIEPQPSAMLDLLGIRLIGITLGDGGDAVRVRYTNQKLPLEAAAHLSEIIDEQRRRTPADLQRQIRAEIEQLAETIVRAGVQKFAKRKTGKLANL